MSIFAVTGAGGFLGWHVRAAIAATGGHSVPLPLGDGFDAVHSAEMVSEADEVIHIAGMNRGPDSEVSEENVRFASQLSRAILEAETKPRRIVFANSIQARNSSPYGRSKAEAARILAATSDAVGSEFSDVLLPNLFGEHGRPFYNSVVATFSHQLASGQEPTVHEDAELDLLHAQDAAELLLATGTNESIRPVSTSVVDVLEKLRGFAELHARGDIPDLQLEFDRNLFNTYRSAVPRRDAELTLDRRVDHRGSFFEVIRSHGGTGQFSFSTTMPGQVRGNHFHRRKLERFTVLKGEAVISMRRLFHAEVVRFPVSGDKPTSIDMPTLWTHNITNTGDAPLLTAFWSNELFDLSHPDTYAEAV